MSNTTKYPQPIYELIQNLLDARSALEDVTISAPHVTGPDAQTCLKFAQLAMASIDTALDLIGYTE